MKTLDRYIIRQFVINFVMLGVVLMLLFMVVDFIVDVDEFVKAGEAHAAYWYDQPWLATAATVVDYYVPVVLLIYVFFNGLLVVGAMGFTIVGLQRNRELTAVIASGVSLHRVAAPVLIAGLVLSAVTLPVQEFLLPPLAPKLVRPKSQLDEPKKGLESDEIYYAQSGEGDLLSAARFDAADEQLSGVRILRRDAEGRTSTIITADRATWEEDAGAWRLVNGREQRPRDANQPNAAAPPDRRPAAYQTDLSPTVLLARRDALYASLLSIRTLERLDDSGAVDDSQRARIRRIISSRFSLMVLNVLILVMSLPFFLKRLPGDMLVSALRAAAVCLGAWGGGLLMLQLPGGLLPLGGPAVVAWLPVVIYLPIAAWQLQSIES